MAHDVNIDVSEFKDFFQSVSQAGSALKREMQTWLDAVGVEFLKIVQDEIKRRKVVDSRLLFDSFSKGDSDNIWKLEDGGMTLEVGSSVDYASFVNDGHWTIDPNKTRHFKLKDGTLARFVPGYWQGFRFIYVPNYPSGMVLKQQWVEGQPYFDSALRILDKMFPDLLEKKMGEWLDKYF